jgi:hypothetical protein
MPKLTPVDYDPWARFPVAQPSVDKQTDPWAAFPKANETPAAKSKTDTPFPSSGAGPTLTPVDHNPFETKPAAKDSPFSWLGLLKSAGTGAARGAEALVGLPGDINKGVEWLADKIGNNVAPLTAEQKATLAELRSNNPGLLPKLPTTDQVISAETALTGGLHDPQNSAERHAEYVSSFLPQALLGPEALLKNVVKRGVVPGVASDALGTAGDAVNPTLGTVGRVAGALVSPGVKRPELPSTEELRNAADAGFDAARSMPVYVKPEHVGRWADTAVNNLTKDGLNAQLAPDTHSVLSGLQNPSLGRTVSMDNLDTVRKTLGTIAGNYSKPVEQTAASRAIQGLDDLVSNLQPHNVVSGDAVGAASAWATARANYAALQRAKVVSALTRNAQLNTDAALRHDIGNATRQQFKKLLTSDKAARGFNDNELAQVEKVVQGTTAGNALRTIGNVLGGAGGLSQAAVIGLGGYAGSQGGGTEGAIGGAVVPLILGALARRGANASVLRQVDKLDEMVRARSPLATSNAAAAQVDPSGFNRFINAALAARTQP